MGDQYIGEIRLFAGDYAPEGWALCDGRLLAITENDALFSLIGATYGGDGQKTFAVPDLRGRVPVHQGTGQSGAPYMLGQRAGVETVTLTDQQMPAHRHPLTGDSQAADDTAPGGHVLASSDAVKPYRDATPTEAMSDAAIDSVGGGRPHDNVQPFQCLTYIIALTGIYPSRN